MAVKAYVLITVDTLRTREVIEELRKNKKLREVNEVLGPYDIVVEVVADELEQVTQSLRQDIRPISGIRNTLTCVVMQ
ncbi:MAG: Lrp/AsnC ligand binding domain-containing protein [Chloroflexi bacterium]|nr:Lrp/AsnC ligand binding domain-containing protein [Chloroflexota bacterium]